MLKEFSVKPEPLVHLINTPLPPNPCWINPGILPKGGTLLFGGHSKTGKSFVMLELARALSTGAIPFNCPLFSVTEPVRVLLIEQELGKYGLQLRVQKVFQDENATIYGDKIFYVSKIPELQLDTDRGKRILHKLVEEVQPQVLLLDPIGRMNSYDENKSQEIQRLFSDLESVLKEFRHNDMSLVLSHHFGKPSGDPKTSRDPMDPYNFRGSSKWFDCPDTLVTMSRTHNLKTKWKSWEIKMHVEARQDEGPPDMTLTVNRMNDRRVRFDKFLGEVPDSMRKDLPPELATMPKKQMMFAPA